MSQVVVLDTGPIGLITNPKLSAQGIACNQWLQSHLTSGSRIILPEIADYEVRRELLRANKMKGISRLDSLNVQHLVIVSNRECQTRNVMSLHLSCDEAIDPIIQVQLVCTAIDVECDDNQRTQEYQNQAEKFIHWVRFC